VWIKHREGFVSESQLPSVSSRNRYYVRQFLMRQFLRQFLMRQFLMRQFLMRQFLIRSESSICGNGPVLG